MRERLTGALSRHFDKPELSEVTNRHAGTVRGNGTAKFRQHRLAMLVASHVDKVDDDDATEIAQTELPRDNLSRLQIGFKDRIAEVSFPDEPPRIDVNGRHGFRLIEDEIAAAFQIHTTLESASDFLFNAM